MNYSMIFALCFGVLAADHIDAQPVQIRIDRDDAGRIFEGAGGVSAGASSRLLYDYPEPYRGHILDYLFKPGFGASLQHLKVEIGCDANTTCGSEPSHARSPEELAHPVLTRGYGYWLMAEAKKRNPCIIISALEWGVPGYCRSHWTVENARYITGFIAGAKSQWGLHMDYISPGRNEDAINREWLVDVFKPMLDSSGFGNVRILAPDDDSDSWKIFERFKEDEAFRDAVDAVGYHYVNRDSSTHTTTLAKESGKSLWASEDWSRTGTWQDAYYLAKILNLFYVRDGITMTSVWPPIDAIYNNLPHSDKGLMSADSPWSGHYTVEPPVWVMAHTNQFAEIGWQYLDGACSLLKNGGTYVTLKDPEDVHFSTIIVNGETRQEIEFDFADWRELKKVHVWKTDSLEYFVKLDDPEIRNKRIVMNCDPGAIYSVTSLETPSRGSHVIPGAAPFPLPYREDFEATPLNRPGKYFADLEGSFEVVNDPVQGHCLRQMLTGRAVDWTYDFVYEPDYPVSIIGETDWEDYRVRCRVRIEEAGTAGIHVRINSDCRRAEHGYRFTISDLGIWELRYKWGLLATGYFAYEDGRWYDLSLRCEGDLLCAAIDGEEVVEYTIWHVPARKGMAGISSSYDAVRFDDFQILELKADKQ